MNSLFGGLDGSLNSFEIEAREFPYENSDHDNITNFTVEDTGLYSLVYNGRIIDQLHLEKGNKVEIYQQGPQSHFIIHF